MMGSTIRNTVMERVATILAGPVLLGRLAMDLATGQDEPQPQVPPEAPRVKIISPEHSVMRRG